MSLIKISTSGRFYAQGKWRAQIANVGENIFNEELGMQVVELKKWGSGECGILFIP